MRIDIFESFIEFCRYMNFSKAAAHLNMTQPALSNHIAQLEKDLGVKLVERGARLRLTPAGVCFFEDIQQVHSQYMAAVKRCRETWHSSPPSLKLLVKAPIIQVGKCNDMFHVYLMAFHAQYPQVDIGFVFDSHDNYIRALANGGLDCVLAYSFDGNSSSIRDIDPEVADILDESPIEFIQINEAPLLICVSKESPLASLREIPLADLNGMGLPCTQEEGRIELTYSARATCARHDIRPEYRPRMVNMPSIYFPNMNPDEMRIVGRGHLLPNSVVVRECVGTPTQLNHIAINVRNGNEAALLLRDFLKETPQDQIVKSLP